MRVGQLVTLFWDGKACRDVEGIVTATHNGHHITVKFKPWACEDEDLEIECRFRVMKAYRSHQRKFFGGWAIDIHTKEQQGYYHISKQLQPGKYPRW